MFRYKNLCFILVLLIFGSTNNAQAQYYYKDVWAQQQLQKDFALLKASNRRTMSVNSFEDDGSPSQGFFLQRKIDKNFTSSETLSKSAVTDQSILLTRYDANGRVINSIDSTAMSVGITHYNYNDKGLIINISSISRNPGEANNIVEERTYSYDAVDKLQKMTRKKNNVLISEVKFLVDDKGNVIEEEETNGRKYYYYYDAKNRLTDVVHFNAVAKRLLPDFIFEYSTSGQIRQQVNTLEGGNNYFIWKFTYNEYGLKETEKVYSKERRILGTVEYVYK